MLQWMGGSRRKVTNTRKSTHKRQRRYFEQKKRQQHSNGDDDAEGTHGSAEYHRTPKSLDILSLLNLTVEAKGDNSGCNNATDGPALRVSPLNFQVPKDIHKVAEIPVLRFSPVNYQLQKDTIETKSPAKEEKCASPQKKFSSDPHNAATFHKYSSNKNGDKSDCWKNATETRKISRSSYTSSHYSIYLVRMGQMEKQKGVQCESVMLPFQSKVAITTEGCKETPLI
ncbi:hypothetical protein C5167_024700 [Papaver somniferum]|uniref:Uncharacterized protein n=1 Tax=Papaver somniferum TaxID=3469 RepID=A0A4Y7JTE1_PAPSO|nr:hypothetical protein C5167_024700 [Papaver somniferum]